MRLVWGMVLALIAMVVGFWPSFFSNPLQNSPLHIVHGVLAAGWMLILIAQAWLMASGRVRIHHWVGRLSIPWAVALLVTAVQVLLFGLAATGERALPMPWRPILAWIDIPSLILFAGFYTAAILFAFRRRIDLHYRSMICTVIVVFSPALGRLLARHVPAFHGLMGSLHPTFFVIEAVCVALIVYDYVTYKRTWAPYWIALISQIIVQWTMFEAPKWGWFTDLLHTLGLPR
jgi:hypothetical protein